MKKYMKFMAIALAAMIALASCSEEKKRKALLPNISGKAGEVIVVIDKGNWEGAVGNVLRDSLAQETPYLPQREPLFGLVNVPKNAFTNMFQIHRNIIVMNISRAWHRHQKGCMGHTSDCHIRKCCRQRGGNRNNQGEQRSYGSHHRAGRTRPHHQECKEI